MPAKHVIKHYVPGNYYHIYNRGFDKSNIFLDKKDYNMFTSLLQSSLDPEKKLIKEAFINKKNISEKLDLVAYCLMPNHFHLMFKLNSKEGITQAIRMTLTSYVMYFNKKYKRQGGLFQGKPRGVLIEHESHLLHLTRYIHQNPLHIKKNARLKEFEYSSYQDYLGIRKSGWVKPDEILKFFRSPRKAHEADTLSYESFVENGLTDSAEKLGRLILE